MGSCRLIRQVTGVLLAVVDLDMRSDWATSIVSNAAFQDDKIFVPETRQVRIVLVVYPLLDI